VLLCVKLALLLCRLVRAVLFGVPLLVVCLLAVPLLGVLRCLAFLFLLLRVALLAIPLLGLPLLAVSVWAVPRCMALLLLLL